MEHEDFTWGHPSKYYSNPSTIFTELFTKAFAKSLNFINHSHDSCSFHKSTITDSASDDIQLKTKVQF